MRTGRSLLSPTDEYASIAPLYDLLVAPFLLPLRRAVTRILRRERGGWVLDLCCGTGDQSMRIHRLDVPVVGLDISPSMLHVARRKRPAVLYCLGDASRLPFRSGSFPTVMISLALHEKELLLRRAILAEAKRVTRSPGRILLVDFAPPATPFARLVHGLVKLVERGAGRRHYECFRDFMSHGGLSHLLQEHNSSSLSSHRIWGGIFEIQILRV